MTISHRTLSFDESLEAFKEIFTRTHPSFSMEWVDAVDRQYMVGEFTSHFTDKPNVKFRKLFYSFRDFDRWNEIFDFGDGYKTWHSEQWLRGEV